MIKGASEDFIKNLSSIKCFEHDNLYVLNSILVNKNSYLGGYTNPKLGIDYDAEIWAGYDRKENKRFEHVQINLIDEENGIELNREKLVKEVGKKVNYGGTKLKDKPNYQTVLKKYSNITIPQYEKPVELIISEHHDLMKQHTHKESPIEKSQTPEIKEEKDMYDIIREYQGKKEAKKNN